MINKQEVVAIGISAIILAFAVTLISSITDYLYAILAVLAVLAINIVAKKIAASSLDSKIEVGLWQIKKYGFRAHQHFEKPIPLGLILALLTSALTYGRFIWFTPLTFDVTPEIYRSAKRHGLYSYSEMTESHIGLIASAGIFANLLFILIGYLFGWQLFTSISIMYVFFNMIPMSNLDGNKAFFGSRIIWSFLAALTLVAVGYGIFLV